MQRFPKSALHAEILSAAGPEVEGHNSAKDVPFIVQLSTLGNIAFYAFNLTSYSEKLHRDHYRIQLAMPKQRQKERRQLYLPQEAFTVISGYKREEEIFVFWDAYVHEAFSYLHNMRINGSFFWQAQVKGISTYKRYLRGGERTETVVICRADRFMEGLQLRIHLSAQRIVPRINSLWENIALEN